jgi:hypothetical protein
VNCQKIPQLIGPDGRIWIAGSVELRRHLGFYGTVDLAEYAVRNLGYVGLRLSGWRAAISARPKAFSPACFRRLIEMLVESQVRQVVLRLICNRPDLPIEVYHDVDEVVARLSALSVAAPSAPLDRPRVILESLSLDRLAPGLGTRQSTLYASWRRRRGVLGRETVSGIAAAPRSDSGLWVRIAGGGRAIVETWPNYITVYPPDAVERLLGGDLSDQPDREYAAGTGEGFLRVAHREQPRLELVDAIITPSPNAAPRRSRYDRLLLPWRSESGERWVSGLSWVRRVVSTPV